MILKDCSTSIVYDKEDEILFKAHVRCTGDKVILHFETQKELDVEQNGVRVDFFDSQIGCIKTLCNLLIRKNTDPWVLEPLMADCTILQVFETLQRQKDLRVKVNTKIDFVSLMHGHFEGTIENISGGGLFLSTTTQLTPGEEFEFQYCFIKREHTVRAKILRETELPKGRFGYGCQFINLTNGAERDIRQYVYKQQLNKIW